jgi:hypothetical protein
LSDFFIDLGAFSGNGVSNIAFGHIASKNGVELSHRWAGLDGIGRHAKSLLFFGDIRFAYGPENSSPHGAYAGRYDKNKEKREPIPKSGKINLKKGNEYSDFDGFSVNSRSLVQGFGSLYALEIGPDFELGVLP